MDDITYRMKKILADLFDYDIRKIRDDAMFLEDFPADSLDLVEIQIMMEGEFKMEIPDEAAAKILGIQQAVQYVLAHQGG